MKTVASKSCFSTMACASILLTCIERLCSINLVHFLRFRVYISLTYSSWGVVLSNLECVLGELLRCGWSMRVQGLCQMGLAPSRPQASLARPSNCYAPPVSCVMAGYVPFYHWSKINLVLKFESMFLHVICTSLSFDMRIYLLVVDRKVYASGSPVVPVSCNQSQQSCTNVLDCCCINRALGFRWNIFCVHFTLCFKHDLVR